MEREPNRTHIPSRCAVTKKEKKKERGEEKKAMFALLVFDNSYFVDSFWPKKKLFDAKGPFGDN